MVSSGSIAFPNGSLSSNENDLRVLARCGFGRPASVTLISHGNARHFLEFEQAVVVEGKTGIEGESKLATASLAGQSEGAGLAGWLQGSNVMMMLLLWLLFVVLRLLNVTEVGSFLIGCTLQF